jgi:hypothetical protein
MEGKEMKIITFPLAVLAVFMLTTCLSVHARSADTTGGVLYFIASDTGACHCMCEKSKYMGNTLTRLTENDTIDLSDIRIVKIDFFGNRVLADSLMKAYGLYFAPAFILADRTGKEYYKKTYDFEEKDLPALRQSIVKLIRKNQQ